VGSENSLLVLYFLRLPLYHLGLRSGVIETLKLINKMTLYSLKFRNKQSRAAMISPWT
jgi:hypothetical protein